MALNYSEKTERRLRQAAGSGEWLRSHFGVRAGGGLPPRYRPERGSQERVRDCRPPRAPGGFVAARPACCLLLRPTKDCAEWLRDLMSAAPISAALETRGTLAAYLRTSSEQAAARELGVQRHTVRNRLARAESPLSVSLDSPDTRAELWLALRLSGHC